MSSNQSESVTPPSYKTINRGIQGFFVFTILGLIFIIWWKTPAGFTYLLEHLKSPVTLLIIPLIIGDYIIGGFRYSLFFDGDILPKISLWNCMRSNWANMFMGAITPFQTGGGPAQIYILWRQGAKISQSAMVSLINFSSTLIFFQAASLFTIFILPPHLFGEKVTNMIQTGFIIIFLATGFIGMILMFPNIGYKIIRFIFSFIPIRLKKLHSLKERLLETLGLEITLFTS